MFYIWWGSRLLFFAKRVFFTHNLLSMFRWWGRSLNFQLFLIVIVFLPLLIFPLVRIMVIFKRILGIKEEFPIEFRYFSEFAITCILLWCQYKLFMFRKLFQMYYIILVRVYFPAFCAKYIPIALSFWFLNVPYYPVPIRKVPSNHLSFKIFLLIRYFLISITFKIKLIP